MVDQELLHAISDMMDKKFKSELQPLKGDLQGIKEDLQGVQEDLQGVKEEVLLVKEDMREVKEDLQGVKEEVLLVKEDVQGVQEEVHQIKLCQENIIEPRLNTIESCYLDTYKRYEDYIDVIDSALDDIKTVKKVVAKHSDQLQRLA